MSKPDYPNVLIVSHEVINLTTSVGKTIHAYFSGWPKEKLSQLYFHSEVPTTHECERYFRITDFDIIKSFIPFVNPGNEYGRYDINEALTTARVDEGIARKIYQKGMQKKDWMYTGRNIMWGLGTWKTKKLCNWIKGSKPDVIFFPTSDYSFPYKIVKYISRRFKIPVVVCVFDDYYFGKINKDSFLNRLNCMLLKKNIENIISKAKYVLYNQPKMMKLYQTVFSVQSDVLYVNTSISNSDELVNEQIKISYFGNLGLGRDKVIIEVGNLIKKIAPNSGLLVDIYSAETNSSILEKMSQQNGIRFMGQVSACDVVRIIEQSNILLLPESFESKHLGRIEYALSTKVPEYLGSNRCILAYGPKEAGSISYLLENNVACVATTPNELAEKLKSILFDAKTRREYVDAQISFAKKSHSYVRNHDALRKAFIMAIKQYQQI